MNLVDNAVENISIPNLVSISFSHKNNQLLIKISNSSANNPYLNTFKSVKNNVEYHGYGLQIVNDIIRQYHARYIKEYSNGYYNVYITFELEENMNE